MGMYTEFHFNAELRCDVPDYVIRALRYMLQEESDPPDLDHPLFSTPRWEYMLVSDSYYFPADTHSTLRLDWQSGYYLCIRCNLKNYDNEIQKFVDWISPYVEGDDGDFLGYYRYEEHKEPTLLYLVETY